MAGIPNNFPADYAAAFTTISRGRLMKVGFQMRERFWEKQQIYGGVSWTTQDSHPDVGTPATASTGRKASSSAPMSSTARRPSGSSASRPPQDWRAAISQGEKIHPDYRSYVETGVSVVWHRMNNMLGCAAGMAAGGARPVFSPGYRPRSADTTWSATRSAITPVGSRERCTPPGMR